MNNKEPLTMESGQAALANCSDLTEAKFKQLVLIRGIGSFVALLFTVALLFLLCCGPGLKKCTQKACFVLSLVIACIFHLLFLTLSIGHEYAPNKYFCIALGFFDEFLNLMLLQYLLLCSTLFLPVVLSAYKMMCKRKQNYIEMREDSRSNNRVCSLCSNRMLVSGVAIFLMTAIVIAMSVAPIITGSYGLAGPWCWIISRDENCDLDKTGFIEQITLWTVPFVLVALWTIILIAIILLVIFSLCCWERKCRLRYNGVQYGIPLLFLSLIFVMCLFECILHFQFNSYTTNFGLLVTFALQTPFMAILITSSMVVYFYCSTKQGSVASNESVNNNSPAAQAVPHETFDSQRAGSYHTTCTETVYLSESELDAEQMKRSRMTTNCYGTTPTNIV